MDDQFHLPRLTSNCTLAEFAFKLRQRVFSSQNQAALHFGISRGTVSRYESENQDQIVPALGYLAGLVELFVERAERKGTPPPDIVVYQDFFLREIRRLLHRFPVEYNYMEAFHTWDQLCGEAASYRAKHTGLLPKSARKQSTSAREKDSLLPEEPTWPINIPNDKYYPLPCRDESMEGLLKVLNERDSYSMIVVDGLGGLGKTAFAVELCRRSVGGGLFEGVVGDSARLEAFTGWEIVPVRDAVLDFDGLLNAIAGQFGLWELATVNMTEKANRISRILSHRPFIVFVDNIETAENAHSIVLWLRQLLSARPVSISKAIITSRKKVAHDDALSLSLTGLNMDDATFYLHAEATERDVPAVLSADRETLSRICTATGGAPLALKLIVAQARFFELNAILQAVEQANTDLYSFLFEQSWKQLSEGARHLLMYMGHTVVSTVGWEELLGSGIAEDEPALLRAVGQLVNCSLLEVAFAGDKLRYGIHPLTRHFVLADLPQIWQ